MSDPAGRVCPLCGGYGVHRGTRDGYPLRECCGILLSFPWSTVAEYEAMYRQAGVYHDEEQRREGQEPSTRRDTDHLRAAMVRLAALSALEPQKGRLLDVGAGVGTFVAAAISAGYDAHGVDPSEDAVLAGYRLGRRLSHRCWREVTGTWDVITLHDVLEHLTAPSACLEHLRDRLTPSGLLVVEMPEWGSPAAEREGLAWRHIRPRQHVALYSDGAARELFRRCGLTVDAAIRPLRGSLGKICYYLSAESSLIATNQPAPMPSSVATPSTGPPAWK